MVHNIQTQANCRYAADESKEESVGMIIGQSVKTGVQKGRNGEQGEAEQQKSSFHEMILTREINYLPPSWPSGTPNLNHWGISRSNADLERMVHLKEIFRNRTAENDL